MATHYTSTSKKITVTNYSYDGSNWATVEVTISITAAGAVSAAMKVTHKDGGYMGKGLVVYVNGTKLFYNAYVSAESETEADDNGTKKKWPYYSGYTKTKSAGTTTSGSVSYDIRIDCMSDGDYHGWTGGATTSAANGGAKNYKGVTSTGTVSRSYWNDISKPSAPSAPTDHYNNTFSASCSAVSDPGNNPVATTIQYKLGDNGSWVDANSRTISNKAHTAEAAADSQTVYVRIKADPTYGDTQYSNSSSTAIKNYVAPSQPTTIPSATKTKTRFTIKEPWIVSWSGEGQQAEQKNNSSTVAGYRIVMLVKRGGTGSWVSEPFKVKANNNQGWSYLGQNPDNKGNGDTWYTVDTSDLSSKTSITIDPMLQGFVPGDKIKIGIRPYILWKAKNPTHENSFTEVYKLFSYEQTINGTAGVDSENYTFTEEITVQNAGVVRVKTGTDKSSFKEGIVWVKINNTGTKTTDWVEADVVKVKTAAGAGGWKESE